MERVRFRDLTDLLKPGAHRRIEQSGAFSRSPTEKKC